MIINLHKGIVSSSETHVRCIFCAVQIPKAKKSIKMHLRGHNHVSNFCSVFDNGIQRVNNVLHCWPCKRALSEEESVLTHSEDETHTAWLDAMEDIEVNECFDADSYLACDNDRVHCKACAEYVDCSFECIQEHVEQNSHQTNVVMYLSPRHGIFGVENDDEVWCKVCDTYLENTIQDIRDHINDEVHRLWFTEVEDRIDYTISLENYLTEEDETHAFCTRCNVYVPCDLLNLEEHMNSEPHSH